jgi:hypothetical protein
VVVQFDVEAALRRHLASQTRRYNAKLHHYLTVSAFAVTVSPFASLRVNSAKGRQWVRPPDRTADS